MRETVPMELTAEDWHERAQRVRKTAEFVDDKARETLLKIARDYESRARQARAVDQLELVR
jgi:hypothetical protein